MNILSILKKRVGNNKIPKKVLFFVSGFALLSICAVAYAYTSTTTFILDNGNDLGAIIVKSTEYYEPTVPYTNASGVKQRMLDAYDYPGDFYTSRNFTKSIIDGSDPYIFVDFAKPKYMGDIDTVHNIFGNTFFSYRKNGQPTWIASADMTSSFLSGYGAADKQSIIVYPIKNKLSGHVVAGLEYPCGNLVCFDTTCSAMKQAPIVPSCKISTDLKVYDDTQSQNITISGTGYFKLGGIVLKNNDTGKIFTVKNKTIKAPVGNYTIAMTGASTLTRAQTSCSSSFSVIHNASCGDKIVQSGEECDIGGAMGPGTGCNVCKWEIPSCSMQFSQTSGLSAGTKLSTSVLPVSFLGTPVGFSLNGYSVPVTSVRSTSLNSCSNTATFVVANPLNSNITATCSAQTVAKSTAYCGDGIVGAGEFCDPNDPKTGGFCTTECRPSPISCSVEMPPTMIPGTANISVNTSASAKISSIKIDGASTGSSISSNIWSTSLLSGNHTVVVTVASKLDSTVTATCQKTIQVSAAICK